MTFRKKVQRYEDTAANWTAKNPALPESWEGVESDTGKVKLGPGFWNDLEYSAGYVDSAYSSVVTSVNNNNYDPGERARIIFLSNPAMGLYEITGLNFGTPATLGETHILIFLNAFTLRHNSASSAAANRFYMPEGGDRDFAPGTFAKSSIQTF